MSVPGTTVYRHHTHRLDLEDPTIRKWTAIVLFSDVERGIVLDRSAFYPGGGGQPPDHGVLLWGMSERGLSERARVMTFTCCLRRETLSLRWARAFTVALTTSAARVSCVRIPVCTC